MAKVVDRNFTGTPGATFANEGEFSNLAGTAPTVQATAHSDVRALRFAAGGTGIISETVAGAPALRVMDRIYKLSGPTTVIGGVCQIRTTAGAIGPSIQFTDLNKMRISRAAGTIGYTSTASLPVGSEFRITYIVNGASLTAILFADTTTTTPLETSTVVTDSQTNAITQVRDGFITATGVGAGVTLDMSWPVDDDAANPGPRSYSAPVVSYVSDFAGLRAAGYTGSLSEMRRQNYLALLSLTEPQGTNNDLELRYWRSVGKTGSLMDARHQP